MSGRGETVLLVPVEKREQPVCCSREEEVTFELNFFKKINWGKVGVQEQEFQGISMYKNKH